MTKITIDRATVEQALEVMGLELPTGCYLELEAALRQALEQPNEFTPDWDQIKPFNDRIAELEKVAKQALEAIEEFVSNELTFGQRYTNEGQCLLDSIATLRQALEQPAQKEPVIDKSAAIRIATALGWGPRREWVGLTDEELRDSLRECPKDAVDALRVRWLYAKDFARAIEAKLKEKNT